MGNKNAKRGDRLAGFQGMIDGTKQFLSKYQSLAIGSEELTPAQMLAIFEELLTSGKSVVTATDAKTTAVKADRELRGKYADFINAFKRIVIGMYAKSPDTLGVFALKPPKKGTRTVQAKAAAAEKVVATRKARHTMGSQQKKDIKGVVAEPSAGSTASAGTGSTPAGNGNGSTTKP
jgi:hypothetical protein